MQTRKSQNCFTDGYPLLYGMIGVGIRYVHTQDVDVFYNIDDIWMSFNTKCNLVDTIEGTVLLNGVANHLI